MTSQHPQPAPRSVAPDLNSEATGTKDLDIERAELDRAWDEFSRVRASVAEVMSDDELRAFGIDVEALDERP